MASDPGSPTAEPARPPRVTVVLNTYQRADVVGRAVEGVLAQTHADLELVVVDDGSTDRTAEVVGAVEDPRVQYVARPNGGLARARNTGLAAATGAYVAFVDDDDEVRPTWLARLVGPVVEREAAVVTCGTEIRSPDGSSRVRLPEPMGPAFDGAVGLFLPGTFLVRRDVLEAVGGYDESLRCSEQTELSLRVVPHCTANGLMVASVPEALVITNRDDEEKRPLRRADYLHSGSLRVLERHGDRLRRNPSLYADFNAVAAVQGARLGRYGEARHLLVEAVRADPSNPKHYGRLAVAAVPPLARRTWGSAPRPSDHTAAPSSAQPATRPPNGPATRPATRPAHPAPAQPATPPPARASALRSAAKRVPGVRSAVARFRPAPWPLERPPVGPPPREPGWATGPPAYVGIGAQRAGTSWWHTLVAEHPDVHVNASMPKEVHHFDRFHDRPFRDADRLAYHELFPHPPGTITGEWTPEYMVWPWCPPLLARCGVDKLIVTLRDPVERFWAGWSFSVRRGAPAVPTIAGDAFHRGLYHRQLEWVLEHFDRSQVLVLQYEACLADTAGQIRRTYEFLGLDPGFRPAEPDALVKAVHPKAEMDPDLRATLARAYAPDLRALVADFPEVDPALWPSADALLG